MIEKIIKIFKKIYGNLALYLLLILLISNIFIIVYLIRLKNEISNLKMSISLSSYGLKNISDVFYNIQFDLQNTQNTLNDIQFDLDNIRSKLNLIESDLLDLKFKW